MRHAVCTLAVLIGVWAAAGRPAATATQLTPYGGNAAYVADLAERRGRLLEALGPDTVAVLWSAPARIYSNDIHYEYRQDSNLEYLTGIAQEQTILVLVPAARSMNAVLFVQRTDPVRALWDGSVLTPDEVTERSGIAYVYPQRGTERFEAFMAALLGSRNGSFPGVSMEAEFGSFQETLSRGDAQLGVLGRVEEGRPTPESSSAGLPVAWITGTLRESSGLSLVEIEDLLTAARRIKTTYEQAVLRQSVAISAGAHVEGMRATRPGRWEYEVEAVIESWFMRHGASWGYPSIVGSGPNATTLHYLASTRRMQDGDLLLVDAAARYQGLTGDITRTYPVNGEFSAAQRAIYDLVLRAEEAGIAAAVPGGPVEDVVQAVRATLGAGLSALGLVSSAAELDLDDQIDLWFPHGPVHGIGMDVHEHVERLDPGTAFVIEPGLYIRDDAFDRVPDSAGATSTLERLRPAIQRYSGIGIRLEDSFLMTDQGPELLSARVPRLAADVEGTVGSDPSR